MLFESYYNNIRKLEKYFLLKIICFSLKKGEFISKLIILYFESFFNIIIFINIFKIYN